MLHLLDTVIVANSGFALSLQLLLSKLRRGFRIDIYFADDDKKTFKTLKSILQKINLFLSFACVHVQLLCENILPSYSAKKQSNELLYNITQFLSTICNKRFLTDLSIRNLFACLFSRTSQCQHQGAISNKTFSGLCDPICFRESDTAPNTCCNIFSEFNKLLVNTSLNLNTSRLGISEKEEKPGGPIILIAGTAGCGKSTLSCLLANKLGISTVLSTDTVRHTLRSKYTMRECPLLYASTYETAAYVSSYQDSANVEDRDILGYLAQSKMLHTKIEFIINLFSNNGPLIVEGVHLTVEFIEYLMEKYRQRIIAFIISIDEESIHINRFANRSHNFATDPFNNKYVHHLCSIRAIQTYLQKTAEIHNKKDETNKIMIINNSSVYKTLHEIAGHTAK